MYFLKLAQAFIIPSTGALGRSASLANALTWNTNVLTSIDTSGARPAPSGHPTGTQQPSDRHPTATGIRSNDQNLVHWLCCLVLIDYCWNFPSCLNFLHRIQLWARKAANLSNVILSSHINKWNYRRVKLNNFRQVYNISIIVHFLSKRACTACFEKSLQFELFSPLMTQHVSKKHKS